MLTAKHWKNSMCLWKISIRCSQEVSTKAHLTAWTQQCSQTTKLWASISQHKQSPEWIAASPSIQISLIYSLMKEKKKEKRFILNFPLPQSHNSLKCTKYPFKRKWLLILSGQILGLFLCTFPMGMLDRALVMATKVKYYKIIHRLG